MPMGQLFGGAFFFLLFLAALTSAISLLEPLIAYMINEVTNEGLLKFGLGIFWANIMLKFVAPALVFIVFLAGLKIF